MPRLAACLAAIALAAPLAVAQQRSVNPKDPKASFIESIEVGWSGECVPEVWNPATVWLGGGERGCTGVLEISFEQDGTQQATIQVPASATPGITVPVDFCAAWPRDLRTLSLTLRDQSGRVIDRVQAQATLPSSDELPLRMHAGLRGAPIISAGPSSMLRSRLAEPQNPAPPTSRWPNSGIEKQQTSPAKAWKRMRVQNHPLDRLPRVWSAYESVPAVVIEAPSLSRMESRSRDALQQWLVAGGRLIVVASAPGSEWRLAFPRTAEYDILRLDDAAPRATRASLASEYLAVYATPSGSTADADAPKAPDADAPTDEEGADISAIIDNKVAQDDEDLPSTSTAPACAAQLTGRAIHLTENARNAGWTLRWELSPDAGFLAEGPVGLGRLTVLGVDPEAIPARLSSSASAAAWMVAVPDIPANNARRDWDLDYWSGSGDSMAHAAAIRACIGDLVGSRAMGVSALLPVWICSAMLVLLIGPFDAVVLRRLNARQRSWATALGWSGLISVVAIVLPTFVRTAPTSLDRIQAVDVRLPATPGERPLICSSAITCVFAGHASEMELAGFPAGTWARGVSPLSPGISGRSVLSPLVTLQASIGHGEGSAVSNIPGRMWVGQWMMRAIFDQAAAPDDVLPSLTGEFLPASSDAGVEWDVSLAGLPPGKPISHASVQFAGVTRRMSRLPGPMSSRVAADGRWAARFTAKDEGPDDLLDIPSVTTRADMELESPRGNRGFPALLPGATERTGAFDLLAASGRWAVIKLVIEDEAGAVATTPTPVPGKRWTFMRLCIPVTDVPAEAAP